jgi:hypothetical protein
MNDLNPTNAFGELLLDLIDGQYGGDYDAGIQALMQTTGLTEEEVVAIIQGDSVVEEESLLGDIVAAFPDADDADLEVLVNVATDVDEMDRQELLAQIDASEMPEEETELYEEEAPETVGAEYNQYVNTANFMDPRVDQLITQQANFQAQEFYKNELTNLDAAANEMISYGIIPPSYKSMLVGNFSDPSVRLTKFAEIAAQNGVDVSTMLFATKFALGLMQNAAEYVEFKDYSVSAEDAAVANFNASLTQVAEADLAAIWTD